MKSAKPFSPEEKEWFEACYDETLISMDQQLLGFLAHLRACEPLTELEFHCYGFRDASGYRLLIPVPCRVMMRSSSAPAMTPLPSSVIPEGTGIISRRFTARGKPVAKLTSSTCTTPIIICRTWVFS
jgi:hypothetical protein